VWFDQKIVKHVEKLVMAAAQIYQTTSGNTEQNLQPKAEK